ncbi:unnamed protein product [Taenia asiatica]|uniref:Velvet domain-containing protein n=1 Tax=Taenia asiatica TaxID=60517 RepID=A0A0R3WEE0_TAEAS|nr:unnamed protein product [Taenia asiatica]
MYSASIRSTNFLQNLLLSDSDKLRSVVLKTRNVHLLHLIIGPCAVRRFYVDVPLRIGHNHGESAKKGRVKLPEVALYVLQEDSAPQSVKYNNDHGYFRISLEQSGLVNPSLAQPATLRPILYIYCCSYSCCPEENEEVEEKLGENLEAY